jgi:hypothetical protein
VERILGHKIEVPERLAMLSEKEKSATSLGSDFEPLKAWLLANY